MFQTSPLEHHEVTSQRMPAVQKVTVSDAATAFGLGWHIAELYHIERLPGESEPDPPDSLPGVGRLSRQERARLLSMEIETALGQLGWDGPERDQIRQADHEPVQGARDAANIKQAVGAIHQSLLIGLTARDARTGKAYGLGRALAETMLVPTTQEPSGFARQFSTYRIRTLQAYLADLRSALPPYSAEVAELTLSSWVAWVTKAKVADASVQWSPQEKRHVGQCLRRQGEIWYGLLTGEMEPLHMLRHVDYVTAAESLLASIATLAWTFLAGSRIGKALGAMIIAFSLLVLGISLTGHLAAFTGATVLLLGSLGVTAGGVVSSVRQVLRQAQAPLWEAELTRGIAAAATNVPNLATVVMKDRLDLPTQGQQSRVEEAGVSQRD